MLLLLGILHLSQNSVQALSLPLSFRDSGPALPSSQSGGCFCPDQRSIWDILWSCLATIFACSWVSVHPNIPGPSETRKRIALRRLELMFWTLIAPEMIILWAMRQWFGARNLAKLWHEKNWTKTHGYFIQMGGFMLYKGHEARGILSPERLKELYEEGEIEFPIITEEEIKDRSKADALAKTFVLGQTTWFIAQCLARAIQGLDLTGLELVTVAFAFLNGFMYFLWWNKPLDVQSCVPVFLLESQREKPGEVLPTPAMNMSLIRRLGTLFFHAKHSVFVFFFPALSWMQSSIKEKGLLWIFYGFFILGPAKIVILMFTRLGDMMESKTTTTIQEGQMRVATFYALDTVGLELRQILCVTSSIAVAFGAIHCAGWFLTFPSHVEALIWRIASIVITLTPLSMVIGSALGILNEGLHHPWFQNTFDTLGTCIGFFVVLALPLYVVARLSLLIEALIGLRALNPRALAVVKWTTFIPHI